MFLLPPPSSQPAACSPHLHRRHGLGGRAHRLGHRGGGGSGLLRTQGGWGVGWKHGGAGYWHGAARCGTSVRHDEAWRARCTACPIRSVPRASPTPRPNPTQPNPAAATLQPRAVRLSCSPSFPFPALSQPDSSPDDLGMFLARAHTACPSPLPPHPSPLSPHPSPLSP